MTPPTSPHLFCSKQATIHQITFVTVSCVFNSPSSSSSFITLCHRSHPTDWPGQWIQGEHNTLTAGQERWWHTGSGEFLCSRLLWCTEPVSRETGEGSSNFPACYVVISDLVWLESSPTPSFLPLTHGMTHTFVYFWGVWSIDFH